MGTKRNALSELERVQRWFQAVITHPDGVEVGAASENARREFDCPAKELEKLVTRSQALTAEQRLDIYANAYFTRLLECLGEVFPITKKALGEEGFNGFAFGFLQKYPSRSYTLSELGRHFAEYLAESKPAAAISDTLPSDWPEFLVELVRFEWVIYEVFDGPGSERMKKLSLEDLETLKPAHFAQARLTLSPSLRLVATRFPVSDYYTAARQESQPPPPMPAPKESFIAVFRREYIVRRMKLEQAEFAILKALANGRAVGDSMSEAASALSTELRASKLGTPKEVEPSQWPVGSWFQRWTEEELLLSWTSRAIS